MSFESKRERRTALQKKNNARNLLNLLKDIILQIYEAQRIPNSINPKKYVQTCHNQSAET